MSKKSKKVGAEVEPAKAKQGDMLKAEATNIIQAIMQIGAMKGMALTAGTARLQTTMVFSEMERSGAWKHLPGDLNDPNVPPRRSFQEAAELWLGHSYKSLAEDRKNLEVLGEQYFLSAAALLPRASVRLLRRLPAEARTELIGSADGGTSLEELKARIDELAGELIDTRETADEKLAEADKRTKDALADLEVSRTRYNERAQAMLEMEDELERYRRGAVPINTIAQGMADAIHKYSTRAERALRELRLCADAFDDLERGERSNEMGQQDLDTIERGVRNLKDRVWLLAHKVGEIQAFVGARFAAQLARQYQVVTEGDEGA